MFIPLHSRVQGSVARCSLMISLLLFSLESRRENISFPSFSVFYRLLFVNLCSLLSERERERREIGERERMMGMRMVESASDLNMRLAREEGEKSCQWRKPLDSLSFFHPT